MDSGVAQEPVDLDEYREQLERRLSKVHGVMRIMINKAQQQPKRVVFPEGEETKILRAAQILIDEQIALPILLGREAVIQERLAHLRFTLDSAVIVDPCVRRTAAVMPKSCTVSDSARALLAAKPTS